MPRLTGNIKLIILLLLIITPVIGQVVLLNPAEGTVTKLHHIAVTVAGQPGKLIKLLVNDAIVDSGRIRVDGLFDFLNVEVPDGPVDLKVVSTGGNNRTFSAQRQIHVLGPPDHLRSTDGVIELPADGAATKTMRLEICDQWGYPLFYLKQLQATLTSGMILTPDHNSDITGIQLPVENGVAEFVIQAPLKPGRAVLELGVAGLYEQVEIYYTIPAEPFILVGMVNGSATVAENNSGNQSLAQQDNIDGRGAVYAKGGIGKNLILTASFDSDRDYYDQLFEDIDPEEQYPLYGDASALSYDVQTKSKFYAKLENNANYLLAGDYITDFNSTEFTAYNRSFNGLQGQLQNSNHQLTGFASLTDRAMLRNELRGEGISGYYYLDQGNVTRFSEQVRLETRDRYHPEQVIKVENQTRQQDYSINYVDGTLMFKQPVPSIDANGNPVWIVIFYEYLSGNPETLIGGIRYQGKIGERYQIGSTVISEEQAESNYLLYGTDISVPLTSWLALKGEFAESLTPRLDDQREAGQAYKAELLIKPLSSAEISAYYRQVDSTFTNNSVVGAEREAGSLKYGWQGILRSSRYGNLSSEYYRQFNRIDQPYESRVCLFNLNYDYSLNKRSNLKFGYEQALRARKTTGTNDFNESRSNLLLGQWSYKINPKLSSTLEHKQSLSKDDEVIPTSTAAGIKYLLTEKVNLFLKYRIIKGNIKQRQAVFGFESQVGENTELIGKYEVGGAVGDGRNRATIGLKNKWQVSEALTFNLSYENTATVDSLEVPNPDHQALSVAVEYLPASPWKASGKYEHRRDRTSLKNVYTIGTDFKIWNGFSSIIKLDHNRTEYSSADDFDRRTHYQLGLVYRPELSDRFNGLAKVGLINDENRHVEPFIINQRMITSIHLYYQPWWWLEFGGRLAARRIVDEEGDLFKDNVLTSLFALRTEFDWDLKWSTAVDLRYLAINSITEIKRGWAVEQNYLIMKNTQVGIGYIFENYDDADFSYMNYDIQNLYFSIHLKLSEDIFNWR